MGEKKNWLFGNLRKKQRIYRCIWRGYLPKKNILRSPDVSLNNHSQNKAQKIGTGENVIIGNSAIQQSDIVTGTGLVGWELPVGC